MREKKKLIYPVEIKDHLVYREEMNRMVYRKKRRDEQDGEWQALASIPDDPGPSVSGLWFYPKSVMTYKIIDCSSSSFSFITNHLSEDSTWNFQDVNLSRSMCIIQ